MNDFFRRAAQAVSEATGSPWAFMLSAAIVLIWAISGPLFDFSDTWQLVINTGTTVATFLMVFLIQNTQNRDSQAVHLKLNELIRAVEGARTHLVDLQELTDDELQDLQTQFERIREREQNPATRSADERSTDPTAEVHKLDEELAVAREERAS